MILQKSLCWFSAQETFIIFINNENNGFTILVETIMHVFIYVFDEYKVQKNSNCLKENVLFVIINVF